MTPKIKPSCGCDSCTAENALTCLEMIEHLHRFTLSSRKATLKRDLEVHTQIEALGAEIARVREAILERS